MHMVHTSLVVFRKKPSMSPLSGPSGMQGCLWRGTHSTSSCGHWKEHTSMGTCAGVVILGYRMAGWLWGQQQQKWNFGSVMWTLGYVLEDGEIALWVWSSSAGHRAWGTGAGLGAAPHHSSLPRMCSWQRICCTQGSVKMTLHWSSV